MNLLRFLLRASPRAVYLAIAASIVGGLSTAAVIAVIRLWMLNAAAETPPYIWAFVGVCVGSVLSKLYAQLLLVGLSRRAVGKLLMQLSRGILAAPLSHLERLGTTKLQLLLTADVQAIVQGLGALPLLCANGAIVAACLGFLAYLSLPVFLTVTAALALGMLLQLLLLRRAQGFIGRTRDGQEAVSLQLQHLLDGVKEMKSHRPRREAFLKSVLQGSIDSQEKMGAASQRYLALADAVGRLVVFSLIGFLLLGLPSFVNEPRANLGGYVLIVFFLMQPLGSIKYLLPQMARAKTAMEKVQAIGLDLTNHAEPGSDADTAVEFAGLELQGVMYTYGGSPEESPFTLGPLDLSFCPGEVVFLAGGNGSGKTTFAKLLTGLYTPKSGEIRVNGRTIDGLERERYRQLFSVVFAEFHLFPGLVGLEGTQLLERARGLLARMRLDRRVALDVEGGFSSTTKLSRGQRKRLALLVALLEDRPFYVFDEWAADQDPHFKKIFYTELLPELKAAGKTVLVITHDERYFSTADRLVMLDGGKLRPAHARTD